MITVSKQLYLRKMDAQDVASHKDVLLALRNDIATALLILSRPTGQNIEDIAAWVERRNKEEGSVFLGIFYEEKLAGYIMFTEECRISGVGEVGLVLHPDVQGKKLGSKLLDPFLAYLHNALDYRKVMARIVEENAASKKLFENHGFTLVGVMQQHRKFSGRLHDVCLYEKLIS